MKHLSFLLSIIKIANKNILAPVRKKIKPLSPDSKKKKFWDIFIVLLTFINFFLFPLEMAFFSSENTISPFSNYNIVFILKCVNFLSYGIDILLNLITGYHIGGTLIMKLSLIRKRYLKSNLFRFDLMTFIPISLIFFESHLFAISPKFCLMNFLFIFILKKYSEKLKEFKDFIIQEKESYENWFSISILYLRTLFISHILACLWYIVGISANQKNTWIETFKYSEWPTKYINSLYWSLVTMVTVGYGDIVPKNEIEKLFCIFTMLVGFTVFGFTMGTFGDIIRKMNATDDDLK